MCQNKSDKNAYVVFVKRNLPPVAHSARYAKIFLANHSQVVMFDFMDCCTIDDLLRQAGLRSTRPRRRILAAIKRQAGAFCAAQLAQSVASEVNQATVFRFLAQLEECGVIRLVVECAGVRHFELACPHSQRHAHFLCERCHKVSCVQSPATRPELSAIQAPGNVTDISIVYRGICNHCSKDD